MRNSKVVPFTLFRARPPTRFKKWTPRQRRAAVLLAPEFWPHQCPVIGQTAVRRKAFSSCPFCGAVEENETGILEVSNHG